MKQPIRIVALPLLLLVPIPSGALLAGEPRVKVTPKEIDDLFANPGMGWQTFHSFADADRSLDGLPTSSAYFRFYWREIEPAEGKIDFEKFDRVLTGARQAGQKLCFRVMCAGTSQEYLDVPAWLKEKGCPGAEYQYGGKGPRHWVPDMDSPVFQEAHFRLIRELGKRYDGHPSLDLVDIGSVGLWGEWHMSGTGVNLPGVKARLAIIDEYTKAFPKSPKVMLIGDDEGMKHALEAGCGWRADCLGDMGGFSKTWNHMRDFYLQALARTGAETAWKTGPVAFESCWDMRKWKEEGWDIHSIFDYALKCHVSYLNNKSAPIPGGTRPEIEAFLRKVGYRLVLRELGHDRTARAGSPLKVSMTWANIGVAPPYRDGRLAFRLARAGGKEPLIQIGETSIRGWLPGTIESAETLDLPGGLEPGRYGLAVAVVDPPTKVPAVRLAIAGRDAEGWYPLSEVEVTGMRERPEEAMPTHIDVFASGTGGYHTFRIPAIECAPDGTLLAFAEGRKHSGDDPGFGKQDIDLVLKRSADAGKTWSKMRIIEDPGDLWSAANPVTVTDRGRGRVWVFYLRGKPERNTYTARPLTDDVATMARWSDDAGETWSEPIDLTGVARDLTDSRWRSSVAGPGGAIQDRKGRLIVPVWKFEPWGVLAISSDDHGLTWKRGEPVPGDQGGDENQLVELADGRVLMDFRQEKGDHRFLAESADGGHTWSAPRPGVKVSPVACAIERYTLRSAGDDRDRILWTGPRGPDRKDLVVRTSYDEGRTFTGERLIGRGEAAYSDLAILKDRTVGVLWERGVERGYQFITFTRFDRGFLEPGR